MKFKNLNNQHFIGWYFKHPHFAIIPSISNINNETQCYIQVITDTFSHLFLFSSYQIKENKLIIGENEFSRSGIKLHLQDDKYYIHGNLDYQNHKTLHKNTMGCYKYIPFLECKHQITSMKHEVNGTIYINDEKIEYYQEKGYIESDQGKSFPKHYVWFQCNDFPIDLAVSFAHATVPVFKRETKGFICIVILGDKEYRFATYNFSKLLECNKSGFVVKKGKLKFAVAFKYDDNHHLHAPQYGYMQRNIFETINGTCQVMLLYDDKKIFTAYGKNAGIEIENESI